MRFLGRGLRRWLRLRLDTRQRAATGGASSLVGAIARVENVAAPGAYSGWVGIEGELWQAVSTRPLVLSDSVKVVGRKGLTLHVVPLEAGTGSG